MNIVSGCLYIMVLYFTLWYTVKGRHQNIFFIYTRNLSRTRQGGFGSRPFQNIEKEKGLESEGWILELLN